MTLPESIRRKTLDDLSYWRADYKFKRSLLSRIERQFHKKLSRHVAAEPALRAVQEQHAQRVETLVDHAPEPTPAEPALPTEPTPRPEAPASVKVAYREVVKRTHPDKTSTLGAEQQPRLHAIYLRVTTAYEAQDYGSVLLHAKRLGVPLGADGAVFAQLAEEVKSLKSRTAYIEGSLLWRWYHAPAAERQALMETYIKKELGS